MLVKTLLIFLITFFAVSEFLLGTSLIQRPLVLGPLVGLAFGQLELGIIMGATLELAFIGAVSIGAYIPPDMISGTILGTALAIEAGAGPETALALGLPISTVMLALNSVLSAPIMLVFTHLMDKDIEEGNIGKFKFHYFFAVQYLGLNTTAIAIFALAYVVLMFFKEKDQKGKVAVVEGGDGLDEF